MISSKTTEAIRIKYGVLQVEFDERIRRMWAAAEAKTLGRDAFFKTPSQLYQNSGFGIASPGM